MALPETELLSETRRPDISSLSVRAPRAGPLQTTLGFGSKEKQFAQVVRCPPAQARGAGRPIPSDSFPRHLTGIRSADVRESRRAEACFPVRVSTRSRRDTPGRARYPSGPAVPPG